MADRGLIAHLFARWTWRMAWRDTRASRGKLALSACSIVLGVAALAAIGSLGANLERAIEEQAKSLLGADLALSSQDPWGAGAEKMFDSLGGVQSREINATTMVYFPRGEGTRLVQLHGLSGGFPFYGKLETDPPEAAETFRLTNGGALADETLLAQFDARIGDNLRVGQITEKIVGRLKKVPGETIGLSAIAPRVYISMDDMKRAGLLAQGSLARYAVYFKFDPGTNVTSLVNAIRPELAKLHVRAETVDERKRDLGDAMDNLYHFLNLAGFIALLLGGVGVGSAIHAHVKQKLGTVAALRCLGCSTSQAFAIYLAQGIALGLFGASLGGALGAAAQSAVARAAATFIPFTFVFRTAWPAVGRAMAIGFGVCAAFSLLPLLAVRRVSPLRALRISYKPEGGRDPLRWAAGLCVAAAIAAFAIQQSRNWRIGLGFAGGLAVVFGALTLTAALLAAAARRFSRAGLPFAARQGVANLHRPNNRTLLLLLSLGLGIFLMLTLHLAQRTLLREAVSPAGPAQANAVLFDIQSSQLAPLTNLVRSLGLPVLDEAPIITMRINSVKGRPVAAQAGRGRREGGWALRREYRSTYSDHLRDGEKIIAGQWIAQAANGPGSPTPISLEDSIAQELKVGLGDEIVFDVQGVLMKTRVASLRTVEWRRIEPNFFVVFPRGPLDGAPAMHVLVTRVDSSAASARMQRAVFKAFPNVSVIDLRLALQTIDSILNKISFVIRFMAMFTVLTGVIVLASALAASRNQRVQESALLRTLGASRGQIIGILAVEYACLGLLAGLTGGLLSWGAGWALAKFVFDMPFEPGAGSLIAPLLLAPALTAAAGFLMSRGVLNHPPLEALLAEG